LPSAGNDSTTPVPANLATAELGEKNPSLAVLMAIIFVSYQEDSPVFGLYTHSDRQYTDINDSIGYLGSNLTGPPTANQVVVEKRYN